MREEQLIADGKLFCPGDAELRKIKLRTHNLCTKFNRLFEDETEERNGILKEIFSLIGEGSFIQGPIYIHYGNHTQIGKAFFGNFNLTIQDDANVRIGDNCNFGPNVTIVTPIHPMLPNERNGMTTATGELLHMCYAKPVVVGVNCWFGANVVVCPGVTIGENCVIGAGSIVVKDVPPNSFAAGNPCKVIRPITENDSMKNKCELWGDRNFVF